MKQIVFFIEKNVAPLHPDELLSYSDLPCPPKQNFFVTNSEHIFTKKSHWEKLAQTRKILDAAFSSASSFQDSNPSLLIKSYAKTHQNEFQELKENFSFLLKDINDFLEYSGDSFEAKNISCFKYSLFLLNMIVCMQSYLSNQDWVEAMNFIRMLCKNNLLFF